MRALVASATKPCARPNLKVIAARDEAMKPRLLIVSPHFPPVNAPDMQRVRMSLPHFVAAGWDVTVLTAADREPMAPVEPALDATVPPEVRVVRVACLSRRWTSQLGLNNLGWRLLPFLYWYGSRLIREWRPGVIYFSTTQFIVLPLGRIWRWRWGTPYVIDLQDPWISNFYNRAGAPRPPGGRKYLLAAATSRLLEGWTLCKAAHVISVSPHYLDDLARRYSWWQPALGTVLPFGVPDTDLALARELSRIAPTLLPARTGLRIAYAGRLGPDMLPALEVLCAAVATWKDSPQPITLHFFGTSYAPGNQAECTTTEVAARHGISHLVHEQPARIGYIDSLRLLLETDVAIVLGSDDAAYSPSKLYPTLAAGRPTIALAPLGSILAAKVDELGGAALVTFRAAAAIDPAAVARLRELLGRCLAGRKQELPAPISPENLILRHGAAAVARSQLEIFTRVGAA